jgi:ribosomal protein S18 acetylase RimI-like enzyme
MRAATYPAFFEAAVASYADDNVTSGRWDAADALALARAETARLLPDGLDTPSHQLFEIHDEADDRVAGYLWLASQRRGQALVAFVYQLIVLPEHRRRGHARAALREAAAVAAAAGHERIELHVFAHNVAAQALYRSVGFELTSLNMAMPLSPPDPRSVTTAPPS